METAHPVSEIVLAAILDARGRLLLQPRTGDAPLAGAWELPGGKVRPDEDHAAFSPDGRLLALAGQDEGFDLWDLATGTKAGRVRGRAASPMHRYASGGSAPHGR